MANWFCLKKATAQLQAIVAMTPFVLTSILRPNVWVFLTPNICCFLTPILWHQLSVQEFSAILILPGVSTDPTGLGTPSQKTVLTSDTSQKCDVQATHTSTQWPTNAGVSLPCVGFDISQEQPTELTKTFYLHFPAYKKGCNSGIARRHARYGVRRSGSELLCPLWVPSLPSTFKRNRKFKFLCEGS